MARSFDLEQAAPPSASPAETAAARRNPYVGPRSLRYGESIYGRDREARQLFDLLIAERIVLLYSPSGAGKTSLIQAALIPALETEEFHVLPVIRVSRTAPENLYACNPYVMSALLSLEQGVPREHAIPPEDLASMSLCAYLQRREAAGETNDGTLLIFDQFEEILTIDPLNRAAKTDFFTQVGEALRNLKRWALFAMREDHVAALDPYLRPIPTRLKSTFRLDLLNAAGARVAIQRPARDCGVEFTEEATTKLVDDLRQVAVQGPTGVAEQQLGLYIEPVQLQVVCFRLWEKLDPNVKEITAEQVTGSGDVDSALADYFAERVAQIAAQSGVKERVIREWFDRRLITESGIRSQVMQGSENSRELNEQAIQLLVNVHLIRGEERRGVMWLELAHDRLVKPIRANNKAWSEKNLSVLQHQAAVWHAQGRLDSLCLRAKARKDAQAWADGHTNELTPTEREFLDVCQRNHDARTNRWALAAACAMAVVVAAFSVLTFFALRESRIATARSIAAQAYQFREERLDTALLLATEAQRLADLPETRGVLISTAFHNPRLKTYLHGSLSPVSAVGFSADGAVLAAGDFDGSIVLWDAKTRRPFEQFRGTEKDAVRAIAFSADGKFVAVSRKNGDLEVRDFQTRKILFSLPESAQRGNLWALAFSRDSALLACGASDGSVAIWNAADGSLATLAPTQDEVRGVSFNADATLLAAGCLDGNILLFSRQGAGWMPVKRDFSMQPASDPEPDPRRRADNAKADKDWADVRCLAISPDGKYVAAGRRSGAVNLFNLSAATAVDPPPPEPIAAFGRHDGAVSALAFSPDSTRLVTSSFDGTLRLWKVPSMEQVGPPFAGHVGRVLGVAFSSDGQTVASGGTDRRAILWDTLLHVAQTGREETIDAPFSVAFSPGAAWEANGYETGKVTLMNRDVPNWNGALPMEVTPGVPGGKRVPALAFSADGRCLAAAANGKVRVHDFAKSASGAEPLLLAEFDVAPADSKKRLSAIAISRDASMVAVGVSGSGEPGKVFAWRVATREPLFDAPLENENDSTFSALAFSPDGTRLVTGGNGQHAVIWRVSDKAARSPLSCAEDHTGSIRCIAFAPDGKIFATASGDNTLIVWSAETGARLALPLTGHQAPVITAAFSPDGRLLASGSDDHSVILWDVKTKQPVSRLTGHTDSVRTLAYSPDGKQLVSGSWGADSRVWDLDPDLVQNICRDRANRNLTENEWAAYVQHGKFRKTWPKLPAPGEGFSTTPAPSK